MPQVLSTARGPVTIEPLAAAGTDPGTLPYTIRILLEAALRQRDGEIVTDADVAAIAGWTPTGERPDVPFRPGRVLLQDFTGVPAVVDLAAMRDAVARLGGDAGRINPQVSCDLVIDHSCQVDHYGTDEAYALNLAREFERNRERYRFLRWGQRAFANFRVVPPATGIIHQINLEYLASVVLARSTADGGLRAFPDTVVGTDSHTTMVNGLGVLGWGVGGIEAEAVMLGQPIRMLLPDVVGFELCGELPAGTTATDLVLTVVERLRAAGVVGKFVEFFGDGLDRLSLADRATVANMGPEYGATCGYFPVDEETLDYLRLTGRDPADVDLVERYCKEQLLFRRPGEGPPPYSATLRLDLDEVVPCLAGPKRPQDRIPLPAVGASFRRAVTGPAGPRGLGLPAEAGARGATVTLDGERVRLTSGAVVIAAITSCTNTSNPAVILTAGLLAERAVARGLRVPPYVKTSLSPGSRVVTAYLDRAGLTPALAGLGFQNVGYGCTTCIGNGGTLRPEIARAIDESGLVAAAVVSGNRNFEGRISPHVRTNYLASPPLVVAFALAGRVDLDLEREPLGRDSEGREVFLADLWPAPEELAAAMEAVGTDLFAERYADVFTGPPAWRELEAPLGERFAWEEASTYLQPPPFFDGMGPEPEAVTDIRGARVLALLGDSVTTDHISPAGAIPADSPAADYLREHGVEPPDFNQYGARRGNDRVMVRGTFGNIRLVNHLLDGVEGGYTRLLPGGEVMSIFAASERYRAEGTPLLVIAGREYGTGSSRDWAAKGPVLLGVRAVLAASYERIHRANLVGMGILPLQFRDGDTAASLGLDGTETYDVALPEGGPRPGSAATVTVTPDAGPPRSFPVLIRLDTPIEVEYHRHGGILHRMVRAIARSTDGFQSLSPPEPR